MILSVKNPNNLPMVDYRTIATLQGELKTLSNENYHKIVHSLNKYGFFIPFYVWQNPQNLKLTLIDGHGRLKVLLKENAYTDKGNTLLPYLVIEADTIQQAKEKLLIISSQYHTITEQGLSDFSFDLDNDIFNLTNFDALSKMLGDVSVQSMEDQINGNENIGITTGDDDVSEEVENIFVKTGDIFEVRFPAQNTKNRYSCSDSTSEKDIEKLMNGEKADMLFTDPPYNVSFNGRSGKFEVIENDNLPVDEFEIFITKIANRINELNINIHYIWCNWKFYGILQKLFKFSACIVWAKNVFGLGRGYRHQHEFCLFNGKIDDGINNESDLWQIAKDTNYLHPTQKPTALCERALNNHKNIKNILDLFCGSGSTAIACLKTKRNCFTNEISPKYVQVSVKRCLDFCKKNNIAYELYLNNNPLDEIVFYE